MASFKRAEFRTTVVERSYTAIEHLFESRRKVMSSVAAVPQSREPLLGPASQRLEIGLLGARTAAVLRRVVEGSPVDASDRVVLQAATDMLESTADAVEFIGGGKPKRERGVFGFGAMALTVELTAPELTPDDLPTFLRAMANDLSRLQTDLDREAAAKLLPAFSTLANVATREAGSVGEGGSSLI